MPLATKKAEAEAPPEEAQPAEDAPAEDPPGVNEDPEPAPEITSPAEDPPSKGSPALDTPSGYALSVAKGDPDKYAKARAEKRYGYGGS